MRKPNESLPSLGEILGLEKIAGKWMFIPLKMVLIGIDPYPRKHLGGRFLGWDIGISTRIWFRRNTSEEWASSHSSHGVKHYKLVPTYRYIRYIYDYLWIYR